MTLKTQPLLPAEIRVGKDDLFYKELLVIAEKLQKDVSELRVLDWGCGRGRYVGFLLSQGVDAYGIDVNPDVILKAKGLFEKNRWNFDKRLNVISYDNRTAFPDQFFDYVISDQVFEHVHDMDSLAQELSRITKKRGRQIHRWPAKFRVSEPHLLMPFVHWIPKGLSRYYTIMLYVALGIEPYWQELKGKTILQKAAIYSEYSHQKTYYRSLSEIARLFQRYWDVEFDSEVLFRYRFPQKVAKVLKINKFMGMHFCTAIMKVKNDR